MILPTESTTNSRPLLADETDTWSHPLFSYSAIASSCSFQSCDIPYRNLSQLYRTLLLGSRRRGSLASMIRQH